MIWNIFTFAIMGIDKFNAINNKPRISEKSLIGSALFFGGVGSFIGMKFFRHKTKKMKFQILFIISAIYTLAVGIIML